MRTLYLILMLMLCCGGVLSAEETTQTETAKTASRPTPASTPQPTAQPAGQQETGKTQLISVQDSGVYTPRDAKITRVENKPIPEVKDIPSPIEQNLFPGESCTFAGVTIQWEVNESEIPKSAGEWAPLGHLHVRGPVNQIEDIDTGMHVNWERRVVDMLRYSRSGKTLPEPHNTSAYVDNVFVFVENAGEKLGTNAHLSIRLEYAPSHRKYTASTLKRNEEVYLSSACPVTLNEWELRLSDKPVRSSDGSEQLQISIQNGKTGEKFELPAIGGAMRRFGRFESKVYTVDSATRTVMIGTQVSLDETVRGREAVVEAPKLNRLISENDSLVGQVIDSLSKEYGFKVEWSGFEGFGPEAENYARGLSISSMNFPTNSTIYSIGTIVNAIMESVSPKLEAVWTDDTHLRIRPVGYEQYKKDKDEKDRKLAIEKRAALEKEDLQKALPEYRAKAMAEFEKEYALDTRIYRLKAISPEAAAQLIGRQLSSYQLVEQYDLKVNREDGSVEAVSADGTLGFHCVRRMKAGGESDKAEPLATAEETAIADPRTNSLLVRALPQTMNTVNETIARMEDAFEQELKSVAEESVPRRRLEVVLLQGTTNDTQGNSSPEFIGFFNQDGVIEQILVKPGQTVKAGDLLAQIDKRESEARYEEAMTLLKREQAVLEEKKNILKTAEQQFAAGTLPESGVATARLAVKEQDARLVRPEQEVKRREFFLKACELRALQEGVVTVILAQPKQEISGAQPVLKIALKPKTEPTDGKEPGSALTEEDSDDPVIVAAKHFGINPDDLKFFHFTDLEERGRTILTLGETTGKEGKAAADLGGGPYRCEFEYQAWRTPYLVVNALLKGPSTGEAGSEPKGLIENTLYLQEGVPSVLGITNLKEGLILVVRLAAPAAQPKPDVKPESNAETESVPQAEAK